MVLDSGLLFGPPFISMHINFLAHRRMYVQSTQLNAKCNTPKWIQKATWPLECAQQPKFKKKNTEQLRTFGDKFGEEWTHRRVSKQFTEVVVTALFLCQLPAAIRRRINIKVQLLIARREKRLKRLNSAARQTTLGTRPSTTAYVYAVRQHFVNSRHLCTSNTIKLTS